MRKSMTELKEEMRAVARGERRASPLPAAPVLTGYCSNLARSARTSALLTPNSRST